MQHTFPISRNQADYQTNFITSLLSYFSYKIKLFTNMNGHPLIFANTLFYVFLLKNRIIYKTKYV